MAWLHDTSSTSGVKINESATSAYSHAAGTLANGVALVRVTSQDSAPASTLSGVTYGGVACTQIGSTVSYGTASGLALSLWYRLAPPAGSAAIVASFTGVMNSHIVSCSTYSGIHQTVPIVSRTGNPKSVIDFDTVDPSEARVTVESAAGELVAAVAAFEGGTVVATTTQTARAAVVDSGNHGHGGSDALATGAATDMSWAKTGSHNNAILGVALQLAVSVPFLKLEIRPAP